MTAAEKLTAAIASAEAEIGELAPTVAALAVETEAALARIAADELAGAITAGQADKLREQAERSLEGEEARLAKLRGALPVLRQRLRAASWPASSFLAVATM